MRQLGDCLIGVQFIRGILGSSRRRKNLNDEPRVSNDGLSLLVATASIALVAGHDEIWNDPVACGRDDLRVADEIAAAALPGGRTQARRQVAGDPRVILAGQGKCDRKPIAIFETLHRDGFQLQVFFSG